MSFIFKIERDLKLSTRKPQQRERWGFNFNRNTVYIGTLDRK